MSYTSVQTRIQFITVVAGCAIICSGILLFASSYMVEELLDAYEYHENYSEFWAGIPTILTGIIIIPSGINGLQRYHKDLRNLGACAVLIVMVLALGVMLEEVVEKDRAQWRLDSPYYCNRKKHLDKRKEADKALIDECNALRKAVKFFYIMLFTAVIVFVLCLIVLLAMFADWLIFTALKPSDNRNNYLQMDERYHTVRESQAENAQMLEGRYWRPTGIAGSSSNERPCQSIPLQPV